MKKSLIAWGIVSLLGVGSFTIKASASDQGSYVTSNEATTKVQTIEDENKVFDDKMKGCTSLTEDQKSLIEKGYNELTPKEKEAFNKYCQKAKRNLSEAELQEYYQIQDKVHEYMDDGFKSDIANKREVRKNNQNNCNGEKRGQGQGKGQGQGRCK